MPAMQVYVDYPQENERIASNVYTFRIGTVPHAKHVDISIDGGAWVPCRPGSGYWWYDWIGFETGEHSLKARGYLEDGSFIDSKVRRFRRISS